MEMESMGRVRECTMQGKGGLEKNHVSSATKTEAVDISV